MGSIFQDLRYGSRRLLRSPGFTITVLLTLCLGIGVNTAIFSIVNAVFFHPLPYKDADRLMVVWQSPLEKGRIKIPIYPPTILSELQDQGEAFDQVAAFVSGEDIGFDIVGGKEPERVLGAVVSDNFFSLLGVEASHGRTFSPGEDDPGNDQVLVVSESLRRRLLDSGTDLIGKQLILNGRSYTVIGVVAENFDFPKGAQLWVPGPLQTDRAMNTALLVTHALKVVARLKPGITPQLAQARLDMYARGTQEGHPETADNVGFWISPLHQEIFGKIRPTLLILWGAVVLVLIIACVNVANLQLARSAGRRLEMAVRSALGASRARLIRQLLTENALLAIAGGGLGFLFSVWAVNSLLALGPPDVSGLKGLVIDSRVLGFTLAASLLTGILFGLVPSLQSSKPELQEALKEGARTSTGGFTRHRLLRVLVVVEIAMAMVLVIGGGLLTKAFIRLTRTDVGFDTNNLLTFRISLPGWRYTDRAQQSALYEKILEGCRALPGVKYAGGINLLPLNGDSFEVLFSPSAQPDPQEGFTTNCSSVTDDYFRTMQIPLIQGRYFGEQDTRNSDRVAIIDRAMAQRFWNDEPLGKTVIFQGRPREIVGVVGDVGEIKKTDLNAQPGTQLYLPQKQFDFPWPYMNFVIRTTGAGGAGLSSAVRAVVWREDKDQPVGSITTLDQMISNSVSRERFSMVLFVSLAALSLVLATVGIYGVMAYSVAERSREIGVRRALGAQNSRVIGMVIRQASILIIVGIAFGLAGAFAMTRILARLLYGVSATDTVTFAGCSLLLAAVALAASYLPARKAVKVDPIIALRNE